MHIENIILLHNTIHRVGGGTIYIRIYFDSFLIQSGKHSNIIINEICSVRVSAEVQRHTSFIASMVCVIR